jgi:hypothetical protein
MSGGCFHTLSLSQYCKSLEDLHQRVAAGHGRVEVKHDDSHHTCVLISKAELESLERALEILSGTGDFRTMCDKLMSLASECGGAAVAHTA